MSSLQRLILSNVEAEFSVIPEAEGEPAAPIHHRESSGPPQRQIKPRNIRTALKKLWLDEMLLTKQILCPVPGCTMVFSTLQGIQNHYQFCTGLNESGIVRCEFCGEQFLSQSLALEIHMAEEHRQEKLMSMAKTDDQLSVVKIETPVRMKKYREPTELIAIPPTPPPDMMIESRRKNVAYSRNQEELIDCEELEGVVRFPLRNLPKGEQEDPLQLPAVMMNLDINLKPKPFTFDDLDENSLMDEALLCSSLMIKNEPIDNAEDDPNYIANMIKKMPEPDLKTVPPVRKRSRQSSGPDVRFVQVIMRANPSEPNAAQSILRDPQFVDAIVQQTIGQSGPPMRKKKKRKNSQNQQQQQQPPQQQQPVYVVAFNESHAEPQTSAIPTPVVGVPRPQERQPQPNIIKKAVRSRKQVFTTGAPPSGLVQVTSSLDQSSKYLQTHTLADKPQVRQEVIDSFFNSTTTSQPSTMGGMTTQPSTSFVEDSSQLVQNIQSHQAVSAQDFQTPEDFQTLQVVSSSDVLNHLGEQGCLIVPPEAFSQLEGAQLIVQDGQIIVQNKNGERVEGCQVVYSNASFAESIHQEEFSSQQLDLNSDPILPEHQPQHHQPQQTEQSSTSGSVVISQIESTLTTNVQASHVEMPSQLQVIPVGEDVAVQVGAHSDPVQISIIAMKDSDELTVKSKEDADTTATQAAEALLTLRPQNRCMSSSPLQDLLKDGSCEVRGSDQVFHIIQESQDFPQDAIQQQQTPLSADDSNLVVVEDEKYSSSA